MTKKMKSIKMPIILTGLGCITLLEIIALLKGINGTLFALVISAIACVIGVVIPTPKILQLKQETK